MISKLGLDPPSDVERRVMAQRFHERFQLRRHWGVLQWQGTVTVGSRRWRIRIPYPLSGAVPDDVGYPRVEVVGLPPSLHRIDHWICLFDPDDEDGRWRPEQGVPRLIELTCLWLDAYRTWLQTPPPDGCLPSWLYGLTVLDHALPDDVFPQWPAKEAPHGRRPKESGWAA